MKKLVTAWVHPVVICTVSLLSIAGLAFVAVLIGFWHHLTIERDAYEQRIAQITQRRIGDATIKLAVGESTLSDCSRRCSQIVDSLGLNAEVRGYFISADLRPSDFRRDSAPSFGVDIFLDCGCVESGHYDVMRLSISPIDQSSVLKDFARRLTLDHYEALTNKERR